MNSENVLDEHALAFAFATETGRNIFLTGSAGTGKTTLLKKIADHPSKNSVIAAPTGVAAINAGGVTMHSLFHLPATCFVPTHDYADANVVTNRRMLTAHLRFSAEKRKVLEEMELLILDEASMIRADVLDAVDYVLQLVRKNPLPFGGTQIMLIGDMHQLPPVTRDMDWKVLKEYYPGPYFFDSLVWKKLDAVRIELKKIYRQQDERFIDLLNNIRDHRLTEQNYRQLQSRFSPGHRTEEKGFILLTTHNSKADASNEFELQRLPGKVNSFAAEVDGDFPESMYPCEKILNLKPGAQVMFIKNDTEEGKYYNGKIATIKNISGDTVTVTFSDTLEDYVISRETWDNIHYSLDKTSGKIEKKQLGSFTQFPLRLAWAITIHKSQGLTFDNVIIDAGQSFAAGQVYVALSRCRTLEGIILKSMISQDLLFVDERISSFSTAHHKAQELTSWLSVGKSNHADFLLKKVFTFEKILNGTVNWNDTFFPIPVSLQPEALGTAELITNKLRELVSVSERFEKQLSDLLRQQVEQADLGDRCRKGIEYFTEALHNEVILPLRAHILKFAFKPRVKKYVNFLQELEDNCWRKIDHLYEARLDDQPIYNGERKFRRELLKDIQSGNTSKKRETGSTYKDTLKLHLEGKTIQEIAGIRSLAQSTIKQHFARWIFSGEIEIHSVMSGELLEKIERLVENAGPDVYAAYKQVERKDFDYSDVQMVAKHLDRRRQILKQNNTSKN